MSQCGSQTVSIRQVCLVTGEQGVVIMAVGMYIDQASEYQV